LLCFAFITVFAFSQWTWQNPLPQGNSLKSVYFTDFNTGYCAGECGTIMKTLNGGTSWNILKSGTTNNLFYLSFTDINTAYAAGANGTILKTADGGNTWTKLVSGTSNDLYAVSFV